MAPISFSAPNSKADIEQLEKGQKPLASESNPPVQRRPDRGFQDMPCELLLKIISFIFTNSSEVKDCSRCGLRKAVCSLNALAGVNQRLRRIVKDRYTLKQLVRVSLGTFGSLGVLSPKGVFDNVLNLDLELLEEGFRRYLENPNNKIYRIFSLAQEVKGLAFDLIGQANALFQRADSIPSVGFEILWSSEKEGFKSCVRKSELSVRLHSVFVNTPCYSIMIKENEPAGGFRDLEETTSLPVLAIAEVLINKFQAAFLPVNNPDHSKDSFYKIPKLNSSVFKIREVTGGGLIRLEDVESLKSGIEGQRFIAGDTLAVCYEISSTRPWLEKYVLDIANSLYKRKGLPSFVSEMINGSNEAHRTQIR